MPSRLSPPAFSTTLPLQLRSQAIPFSNRSPPTVMALEVGQHVRVTRPIVMYHYPRKKNIPVDVEGFEGVIVEDISVFDGTEMSATAPYLVEFSDHPKFKAHFEESELELI